LGLYGKGGDRPEGKEKTSTSPKRKLKAWEKRNNDHRRVWHILLQTREKTAKRNPNPKKKMKGGGGRKITKKLLGRDRDGGNDE